MKILESLKLRLWRRECQRVLNHSPRKRAMMGLDHANSVGIFFIYTGIHSYELVRIFANDLERRGMIVEMLSYENAPHSSTGEVENSSYNSFHQTSLRFNRITRSPEALAFCKKPFDILFDFSVHPLPEGLFIRVASQAKFKIGRRCETFDQSLDFSLDVNDDIQLKDFIDVIIKYLNNFNS